MSGVDNRIVTMKFDNREFENNAKTSMSTLQKLKESMNFGSIAAGTIKGLDAINGALSKIGLKTPFAPMIRTANAGLTGVGNVLDRLGMKNPFSTGIQSASEMQRAAQAAGGPQGMGILEGGVVAVSNKFIALSTIAITALSNITNRALNAGTSFVKSFTFGPIQDGLQEYETNLKSIQTVQANTDQPLDKINASLEELNRYSDQTIYNFSEMARNVGTFTAAGVDLETSVASIKGIANLAALSGSSSEQAATAMYQLSQAIAAGRVGLMDWNSVVNAGMGGKKLQNALAQTAVAMGELDAKQVKLVGSMDKLEIKGKSFRESIMAQPGEETWLSSEALVNTLAAMDGRFSTVALKAEKTAEGLRKYSDSEIKARIEASRLAMEQKNGVKYTDEQFAALQKMSTSAFQAATQVKTLGQVFQVARETIGSGWSASFKNIFGTLDEAKALFTGMSNTLTRIINKNALARNTLLNAWKEGGGRADVIEALGNAWQAVWRILQAVGKGFRDVFPKQTADSLIAMSENFKNFTQRLIPGKDTLADIRDIASGVFSVFHIGLQIIGGVVDGFKALFSSMGAGNGDFLDFAAGIGRSLTAFDQFLEKSGIITTFFTGLGHILAVPVALLQGIAGAFSAIFAGFNIGQANDATGAIDGATSSLDGLSRAADAIRAFFSGLTGMFVDLGKAIGAGLAGIGDLVADALTSEAFGPALDAVNTGLLAGITGLLIKFFTGGVKVDLTGGIFGEMAQVLDGVTGSLSALQTSLKADALLKIGIAIGVLAASLLVLSTIDPSAMRSSLGAMAAGFGVLIAAMAVMMKVMGPVGIIQLYATSAAMTNMSLAILALAGALKVMSSISFGDMMRGLLGLSLMLKIINKAILPLAAGSKGMIRASFSLIALAVAINLMAVALKIFATMSWGEMIKGLAGLTGVLLAMTIGLQRMPPLQAQALGLIALGAALNLIAVAMKIFATMSWEEMAKGLVMLTGSLLAISLAINTMPKTMLLQAAALVVVAGALVVLSGALKVMGSMGWEEIAKGMVVLAGSLLILAVGLQGIGVVGAIGAVGLLAAAAAMAVFAPVMLAFGAMDWMSILKAMAMLAGTFVILGVAGYALAPVTPVLIGLGAALLLLGAGLALAGAGALLAATAFGIVVAAGSAGAQVLADVLAKIIAAIPPALKAFGDGIVQFAVAIGQGAPRIIQAFGKILTNLLNLVIRNAPKVARAFLAMLNAAIRVVVQAAPKLANAGMRLIIAFLNAISKHIGKIMDLVTDIIVKFLDGLARNLPRIIEGGVRLILAFMRGVAKAIREHSKEFGEAGADIGIAIIEGVYHGIEGAAGTIKDKLVDIAKDAWNAAKDFLGIGSPSKLFRDTVGHGIPEGWALGIGDKAHVPLEAVDDIGGNLLTRMSQIMSGVDDAFALDGNLNPTITPVLDLSALTQEANKMSSILATAPIMAGVSYQTAADISAMTQASSEDDDSSNGGDDGNGGRGDTTLELHLHSPKPIDSVESYRAGKTLISLAKEALK